LGYLTKNKSTKQFSPATKILEFGYMYLRSDPMIELAAPHLLAINEQCQEMVNFGLLVGTSMMYITRIPNRRGQLPIPLIGSRGPVYCTASG
jgi:IclR family transcriptional regulator, pca regulon regulatory protein